MVRFKDLTKKVKAILEECEAARNDDNVLYLHLIRQEGRAKGLDIDNMYVPTLLLHWKELSLPSLESTGRIRRKVQGLHPELGAEENVEVARELLEEQYRTFAREVHYV